MTDDFLKNFIEKYFLVLYDTPINSLISRYKRMKCQAPNFLKGAFGTALTIVLLLSVSLSSWCAESKDSIPKSGNWIKQVAYHKFDLNNPEIDYPKFPRFCVTAYNWANKTFNTFDSTYVVGTGKNWKARLTSNNWLGNNMLLFSKNNRIQVNSNIFSEIGPSISFMALNLGYMVNVNELRGDDAEKRHRFNLGFNCALFSANFDYSYIKGGTRITRFGDFNGGKRINLPYNDIKQEAIQFDVSYIFNNRRYSQVAGYAYSKYQLRSAGSWLLGVAIVHQNNTLDFTNLPDEMKSYLPLDTQLLKMKCQDYSITGGYGYNWVFHPKWLVNIMITPSIGYRHSYTEQGVFGGDDMFSTNIKAMMAIAFNHRSMFAGIISRFDGFVFYSKDYTYANSIQSLTINCGVRF
ncbi:MAG: DUF4421 domain-containing protein [Muribaculaceae bacterium]